jgi:hypothetical protein
MIGGEPPGATPFQGLPASPIDYARNMLQRNQPFSFRSRHARAVDFRSLTPFPDECRVLNAEW